jgi:hypothetical protein
MSFKSIILVLMGLVVTFFGVACVDEGSSCGGKFVVIRAGDTAWSLAREHCSGNRGDAVDRIVKEYGTDLQIGQGLILPD